MSLLTSRLARLAAAVSLTAVAGVTAVATAPSASASACTSASGVTVIADFNQLGGGVPTTCLADGAGKAASVLFEDAGLPLTYAQRQPGFVCRVQGAPTSDPCVNTSPADAFWGLWWSDGDSGSSWTYSSLGVGSLKIPAGGLVAFAWDEAEGQERPSAAATRPAASPSPSQTSSPSSNPTPSPPSAPGGSSGSGSGGGGNSSGSSDGGSGSGSSGSGSAPTTSPQDNGGDPTASPTLGAPASGQDTPGKPGKSGKPSKQGKAGKSQSADDPDAGEATEQATDDSQTTAAQAEAIDPALAAATEAADEPGDGLPGWAAPALIVLLFGTAGLAWWLRRRGAAIS